jgi:hypothetical protein
VASELKPCGTPAAYARHLKRDEAPCDACRFAWNAYCRDKQYARRQRIMDEIEENGRKPPSSFNDCGTRAAYLRHHYRGESACLPCREAESIYAKAYKEAQKAR